MKRPRTLKEIKNHPAVESIEKEYEGANWDWACWLKDGYLFSTDASCTFAQTLREISEALEEIEARPYS